MLFVMGQLVSIGTLGDVQKVNMEGPSVRLHQINSLLSFFPPTYTTAGMSQSYRDREILVLFGNLKQLCACPVGSFHVNAFIVRAPLKFASLPSGYSIKKTCKMVSRIIFF